MRTNRRQRNADHKQLKHVRAERLAQRPHENTTKQRVRQTNTGPAKNPNLCTQKYHTMRGLLPRRYLGVIQVEAGEAAKLFPEGKVAKADDARRPGCAPFFVHLVDLETCSGVCIRGGCTIYAGFEAVLVPPCVFGNYPKRTHLRLTILRRKTKKNTCRIQSWVQWVGTRSHCFRNIWPKYLLFLSTGRPKRPLGRTAVVASRHRHQHNSSIDWNMFVRDAWGGCPRTKCFLTVSTHYL